MNRNNAKDYLPLVQALVDGKTIQWRNHSGKWEDTRELSDSWIPDSYRIKPEPREIWVVNGDEDLAFFDKCDALEYGGRVVRYREVTE